MLLEKPPSEELNAYGGTPMGGAGTSRNPSPPLFLMLMVGLIVPLFITFGFALAPELQVVAVVLGILGVMLIFADPFWGLVGFVGLLYTRPEEVLPALAGMRLTLMVSVVTLVALVFRLMIRREAPVKTPLTYLMAGFSFMVVITSLTTGMLSTAVMDVLKLFILVMLVLNLVHTPKQYHRFVTALIFFTGYLAAYSILLYYSGQAMQYQQNIARGVATGIFSDPNDLAASVVGGLALALSRISTARPGAKLFYILTTLVMVWAIFLTNSRGGLIALLLVIGAYFLTFSKRKALALVLAGLACVMFLAAAPSRMKDFDSEEESANSRFHFWANGLDVLQHNPLSGAGYEQFPALNGNFTAHNSFVLCFAELGLPGYFFWMGMIYYAFRRRPEKERGEARSPSEAAIDDRELLGARLALTGYMAACFWISRTYVPIFYMLFSLPIAQQLATTHRTSLFQLPAEERRRDWGRIALVCLGSIIFIKIVVMILQ